MRYDAIVTMRIVHVFAVEADSATEAQMKAIDEAANRSPDKVDTNIEIEVGNG